MKTNKNQDDNWLSLAFEMLPPTEEYLLSNKVKLMVHVIASYDDDFPKQIALHKRTRSNVPVRPELPGLPFYSYFDKYFLHYLDYTSQENAHDHYIA